MNAYATLLVGILLGILLPSMIHPFYQAIQQLLRDRHISPSTADHCSTVLVAIGLIPAIFSAAITITPKGTFWSMIGAIFFTLMIVIGLRFINYRKF